MYVLATYIKHNCFEAADYLISHDYYVSQAGDYDGPGFLPFQVFTQEVKLLEYRTNRLGLNTSSLHADLLKQRNKGCGVEFGELMQVDFILSLRNRLAAKDFRFYWWPETLYYLGRQYTSFEVFARSRSKAYFERIKNLFGVQSKDELVLLCQDLVTNREAFPRVRFSNINPAILMGIEQIATKP